MILTINKTKTFSQQSNLRLVPYLDQFGDITKNKRPFMANFYKLVRTKMNLLMNKNGSPKGNKWSFDEETEIKAV